MNASAEGPGSQPDPPPREGGDAPRERTPSRRYWLNLGLFLVLVVGGTVWFQLHLEPWVTESLIVGGYLTVWGMWQGVRPWIEGAAGSDLQGFSPRLLTNPNATPYLGAGAIVLAGLFLTTSSLYLEYAGAPGGVRELDVEVRYEGNPYLEPLALSSWDRVAGRPFFRLPWDDPRHLEVHVTNPRGYAPETVRLGPRSAVRLGVPAELSPVAFHLLRVIPGVGVRHRLAPPRGPAATPYALTVSVGDTVHRVKDVRKQSVVLGADSAGAAWRVDHEEPGRFLSEIRQYLAGHGMSGESLEDVATSWSQALRVRGTTGFSPGDTVGLELHGAGPAGVAADTTVVMPSGEGIRTVFLEPGGPDG